MPQATALLDRWLSGESGIGGYMISDASRVLNRTALRIVGENVETSMGAEFPIRHALLGLALVRRTMAQNVEWKTNGHTCHLGHYKIDRISPDGTVYAGCHIVKFEEIARIQDALLAFSNAETERAKITTLAATNSTPQQILGIE